MSLIELPKEIARVRDTVIPMYAELGRYGQFRVEQIRKDLAYAAVALNNEDLSKMMLAYHTLKDWKCEIPMVDEDTTRLDALEALPGELQLFYNAERPKSDLVPTLRSQIDYFLEQIKEK